MTREDIAKQMATMLDYVRGDTVTRDAFGQFLRSLATVWKTLKSSIDEQFNTMAVHVAEAIRTSKQEMRDEMRSTKQELLARIAVDNQTHRKQMQSAVNALQDDIRALFDSIPQAVDLEPLQSKIEQVRASIPAMKTLPEVWDAMEELRSEIQKELEKVRKEKQKAPFLNFNHMPNFRDLFKDYDLSAQLDGATTTFNIPAVYNVVSVALSSYPYGSLRKGVDFTWTPTSITFLSTIDPTTQLAAGQSCVLTIVSA